MSTIRAIAADELEGWLAIDADDASRDQTGRRIRAAWDDGLAGPRLTFIAEDPQGRPLGRLAYLPNPVASVMPDIHEALIYGLWLDWSDPGSVEIGRQLVEASLPALPGSVIAVDGYANPAYMEGAGIRRAVFEAAGQPLFQEKEGFLWTPATSPASRDAPRRLEFRTVEQEGPEAYAAVMSRCAVGTLDRNDAYYARLVSSPRWGPEMLGFLEDEDASSWLLAFEPGGAAAGYVALGSFDEPGRGTIIHIGVVPELRGRGHVTELLAACNAAALRRGFDRVLSDIDVENAPMAAALERAGHRAAATDWHVHHHRLEIGG